MKMNEIGTRVSTFARASADEEGMGYGRMISSY